MTPTHSSKRRWPILALPTAALLACLAAAMPSDLPAAGHSESTAKVAAPISEAVPAQDDPAQSVTFEVYFVTYDGARLADLRELIDKQFPGASEVDFEPKPNGGDRQVVRSTELWAIPNGRVQEFLGMTTEDRISNIVLGPRITTSVSDWASIFQQTSPELDPAVRSASHPMALPLAGPSNEARSSPGPTASAMRPKGTQILVRGEWLAKGSRITYTANGLRRDAAPLSMKNHARIEERIPRTNTEQSGWTVMMALEIFRGTVDLDDESTLAIIDHTTAGIHAGRPNPGRMILVTPKRVLPEEVKAAAAHRADSTVNR